MTTDAEQLVTRLREHGVPVADTDAQSVRTAILNAGIASIVVWGRAKKPVRYSEAFEAAYGEPLEPPAKRIAGRGRPR